MRKPISAIALLISLAGCVSTPMGPTVQVLPSPGKPLSMFADDDLLCRHFAEGQVEGEASHANWSQAALAGGIGLLGAGVGGVLGGGKGALVGAGVGSIGGAAVGGTQVSSAQSNIQTRYNNGYIACQITHGNLVRGL